MARPGQRAPGHMRHRALRVGTQLVTALLAGCVLSVATSGVVPLATAIAAILAVGFAIGHADRKLWAMLREELEPADPGRNLSGVDEMEFPLSANGTDGR